MIRLSGRLRSAVLIGVQGIRARKTRTLLSTVSLFLGVLAVVVVQAGYETAQRAMLTDIEMIQGVDGTLVMHVWGEGRAAEAAIDAVEGRSDAVALTGTQVIIGEPNVRPVNEGGSPFDEDWGGWSGPVEFRCDPTGYCYEVVDESFQQIPEGAAIEVNIVAMTGDVRQFKPFRPLAGQWLDFSGDPSYSPALVVNREAARGFGRYLVPAEMRIPGGSANATPRIIGVVDDGQRQPIAYVRMDELLNWLSLEPPAAGPYGRFGGLSLEVLAAPTAYETMRILRANLTAAGVPPESMYSQTIESRKQIESTLSMLRAVFLGMAALVLFIGVAGILNVGLATVGERVEEFALRRAVGTPRLLLAGIVLAETMLTGLLTAAAAIGVAAVGLQVAGPLLAREVGSLQDMVFPWQAAMAGVIAGLVAGVLGGLVPAIRAARIPIATVMRA